MVSAKPYGVGIANEPEITNGGILTVNQVAALLNAHPNSVCGGRTWGYCLLIGSASAAIAVSNLKMFPVSWSHNRFQKPRVEGWGTSASDLIAPTRVRVNEPPVQPGA